MQNFKENIGIYFKSEESKEDVLKNASGYEKYIILMNETLQSESRDLAKEIKEVQQNNDDLQDQIDKSETTIRYMRGLLKNLVELDRLRITINSNYNDFSVKIKDNILYNIEYIKKFQIMYRLSALILFIAILYQMNADYKIIIFILCTNLLNFIYSEFVYYHFEKSNRRNINTHIALNNKNLETNKEIKKITDAQDFLYDYIDSL